MGKSFGFPSCISSSGKMIGVQESLGVDVDEGVAPGETITVSIGCRGVSVDEAVNGQQSSYPYSSQQDGQFSGDLSSGPFQLGSSVQEGVGVVLVEGVLD